MPSKARDAFRTISEVADWLDVPAHVLRFWESKFSQIKPVKRAGGRRYYRPDDMLLIGGIKKLLHDDGMTIRGVQKMLKEDGIKVVSGLSQTLDGVDAAASPRTQRRKAEVQDAEDTMAGDMPPKDAVEEADTIAAWDADAQADEPKPEPEQEQEQEPKNAALAEDNVVAMTPRDDAQDATDDTQSEPEFINLTPEADDPVEPATKEEPAPEIEAQDLLPDDPEVEELSDTSEAAQVTLPPAEMDAASDPNPEPEPERPAVQLDPDREKTLPPVDIAAAPPAPSGPSDNQIATRALKRRLRGTDPAKLTADPALGAHAARLAALRDRIAAHT